MKLLAKLRALTISAPEASRQADEAPDFSRTGLREEPDEAIFGVGAAMPQDMKRMYGAHDMPLDTTSKKAFRHDHADEIHA